MQASDFLIRTTQAQAAAVSSPTKFKEFNIHTWYIDGYGWVGEVKDQGNNILPRWMNTSQGYTHRFMAVDFMILNINEYLEKLGQ